MAFTSGVLSSECAVVWFVGLSLLPSVSAVTHGKRDFDAQSLLVALYDVLGPPRFQRLLESRLYRCPRHHEWSSCL